MTAPGLVTRSVPGGDIEILNAGSMVGNTQLRYGAWKWSKTSYRTGVHFCYAFPEITAVSPDSALTAELADGRIFGRHSTVPVELDEHHLGYSWNLGSKVGQVNTGVETFVFWRDGWLLQVHTYDARQPVTLRVGGFALPITQVEPGLRTGLKTSAPGENVLSAFNQGHGTVLQPLLGLTTSTWDTRLDDTTERRHVAAPYHVTPIAGTAPVTGRGVIAALVWAGTDRASAAAWQVTSAAAGVWQLTHPKLGDWTIRHWSLPALS
jgi:hypothetical protein